MQGPEGCWSKVAFTTSRACLLAESNEHQFRTPSLIPARTVVAEV